MHVHVPPLSLGQSWGPPPSSYCIFCLNLSSSSTSVEATSVECPVPFPPSELFETARVPLPSISTSSTTQRWLSVLSFPIVLLLPRHLFSTGPRNCVFWTSWIHQECLLALPSPSSLALPSPSSWALPSPVGWALPSPGS